ncbi:hypothetical protein ABW19_dt0205274 [Dactylella cylindrospora]|nr:hypothetical protein ABW19_dt0205274 [Dactylella cylindrospora]
MALLQRQFGKLLKRSADDADVAQIITDVKNYDERLDKASYQISYFMPSTRYILYKPIPGERAAIDPARQTRAEEWCAAAADMKEELSKQTEDIGRILEQTTAIKSSMKPVKKVLEKRENSKLDYERYTSNAESARKRGGRSEREAGTLAKAERQLEQATKTYNDLDEHIKKFFPPILDAIATFVPYILYAMEKAAYAFASHKYTIIYQFAERHGLQDYQNFKEEWSKYYLPVKEEAESLALLQGGKAVHKPMEIHPPPDTKSAPRTFFGRKQSSKTESELPTLTKIRSNEPPAYSESDPHHSGGRPMSRQQSAGGLDGRPMSRQHSSSGLDKQAPPRPISRKSSTNLWAKPSDGSIRPTAQKIQSSTSIRSIQQEAAASGTLTPSGYSNGLANKASSASLASAAAAAVAKKKPPPPVPTKSKPQIPKPREIYVTALYKFDAQNAGDLSLREGDRVKVIDKTDSVEDWWEGECVQRDGTVKRGFFPANYCQLD